MSAFLASRTQRIASLGAAILLAGALQEPAGAEGQSRLSSMSIDDLKSIYLSCERTAMSSKLDGGDAMYCSQVYEELKEKAFGGDYRLIKSWLDRHSNPSG